MTIVRTCLLMPVLMAGLALAAEAQDPPRPVAAVLRPYVDRHELAGAVTLVADRDAVLDLDAVGHADRAAGTSMRPDAVFWIAHDLARFCQMVLRGGKFEGERYLSEAAVQELTTRQTAESIKENDGLGWSLGGGTYDHGGAYATNMTIDPRRYLITIYLV